MEPRKTAPHLTFSIACWEWTTLHTSNCMLAPLRSPILHCVWGLPARWLRERGVAYLLSCGAEAGNTRAGYGTCLAMCGSYSEHIRLLFPVI